MPTRTRFWFGRGWRSLTAPAISYHVHSSVYYTYDAEVEIDLDQVKQEITTVESQLATVRKKMQAYLEELEV